MNQEKIGKFISKCRKQKNLTQVEIAEKLGVSDKSVSKWETGKCMPDLSLFNPLCEILGITVNDLMSGEIVDNKEYANTLGENIINMVSDLECKKQKKRKWLIISFVFISILLVVGLCFYFYCEIDVKYDDRVIVCDINEKELNFTIKGQSVCNTYYTIRKINNKNIYFFHSTVNVYNKARSNWEYSQSMAKLLENKKVQFGSIYKLDIDGKNIEVYYTDSSIRVVKNANEDELKKIIKNSYLMCEINK